MIVIIDYGMGNLGSIVNMLKKIGVVAQVSSDPNIIKQAEKLILPGVGAFDNGMQSLTERNLIEVLNECVLVRKTPILGLCLGIQLFTRCSEEGTLPGLGWIEAETIKFQLGSNSEGLKVPHMGWNYIAIQQESPLFNNMPALSRFYFVHSYHLRCQDHADILATSDYGYDFPSIIRRENIIGAQFHPEKSHKYGMALLRNFVEQI
ncbi:MAG: imidazole glycerol phosphate synthase subunit HisH [Caldilineaceae bacterium]